MAKDTPGWSNPLKGPITHGKIVVWITQSINKTTNPWPKRRPDGAIQ